MTKVFIALLLVLLVFSVFPHVSLEASSLAVVVVDSYDARNVLSPPYLPPTMYFEAPVVLNTIVSNTGDSACDGVVMSCEIWGAGGMPMDPAWISVTVVHISTISPYAPISTPKTLNFNLFSDLSISSTPNNALTASVVLGTLAAHSNYFDKFMVTVHCNAPATEYQALFGVSIVRAAVTFEESGLPSGNSWDVTLDGTPSSTVGTSLSFDEWAGDHTFSVTSTNKNQDILLSPLLETTTATIEVGADITIDLQWLQKGQWCYLAVYEFGLPSGMTWSVTYGCITQTQPSGIDINYIFPKGTYSISASSGDYYTYPVGSTSVSVDPSVNLGSNFGVVFSHNTEDIANVLGYEASVDGYSQRETLDAEGTLRNCKADIVVRGEGEITIVEVIRSLLNGETTLEKIRGLSWRSNKGKIIHNRLRPLIENLDELPFPDFDLFPSLNDYQPCAEDLSLPILTSRGCVNNCVFCSERKLWGGRIRKRTVENVIDEIRRDISEYRIKRLEFCDDTLNVDRNWLIKLCSGILREKLDVKWHACMRLDRIDKHLISWLRRSGCVSILFGVESCVPSTLSFMNKGYPNSFTETVMRKNIKKIVDSGIMPIVSFIIGFPCENEGDILKNISFMTQLRKQGSNVTVHLLCPEVGTEIKEKNKTNLVRNPREWEHEESGIGFTDDCKRDANLYPGLFMVRPNKIDIARLLELYAFALCVTGNAPPQGIYI